MKASQKFVAISNNMLIQECFIAINYTMRVVVAQMTNCEKTLVVLPNPGLATVE